MAAIRLVKLTHEYIDEWNSFVETSNNGTIFHRLDFLAYHKEKFARNEHHLIWFKGDQVYAVMPLAIFEIAGKRIAKSPYGGSYGGIITRGTPNYSTSTEIVVLLIQYLKNIAVDEVIITLPLSMLCKTQSDTLLFCLLEKKFIIVNSDISSVVILEKDKIERDVFTSRARNMARKARKFNVIPKFDADIADFWKIMELTFNKHNGKPTHNHKEWRYLCERFPKRIYNDVAYIDNIPVAGIGHIMINDFSDSSFYLCSDPNFYETQALTLLIYETILRSKSNGCRRFDFGTSSVNMIARSNIFSFKESFGAIGSFRHTIKLVL